MPDDKFYFDNWLTADRCYDALIENFYAYSLKGIYYTNIYDPSLPPRFEIEFM